jgi:hypothetical protein
VAERRRRDTAGAPVDGKRLYAELNSISQRVRFVVAPEHPNHARARQLDKKLLPARSVAKAGMAACGRKRHATPEAVKLRDRAWELVEAAGRHIDAQEGWWLAPDRTTLAWAHDQVEAGIRAQERQAAGGARSG